jgi:hypothetical protein
MQIFLHGYIKCPLKWKKWEEATESNIFSSSLTYLLLTTPYASNDIHIYGPEHSEISEGQSAIEGLGPLHNHTTH